MIGRQKLVGWALIAIAGLYAAYFLKVRLLGTGPAIAGREWLQFSGMIVILMLGTANIRLAAMREQKHKSEETR